MRQRVALVRTLINNPEILLMDEPFGALDAMTRVNMQSLLRDLWHKGDQTFFLITFPLLKPISATVAALHVMWLWNDFNIALILLQKDEVRTLTVKQFYFFGQYTADYGVAFAVTILSMIPVVIFFLFMQRYIINGIAAGAVKS